MRKGIKAVLILTAVSMLLSGCTSRAKDSTSTSQKTTTNTSTVAVKDTVKMNVMDTIHINQIGFLPKDSKVVVINGKGGDFEVVDEGSGKVAFKGEAKGGEKDASTGDTIYKGDFTGLEKPGKYYIRLPDYGISYSFTIGDHVYKDLKNGLLKALYYQRCGVELEGKYAGQWVHGACHKQVATLYGNPNKKLDGSGGWHDAGDYGKYSTAGAVAAANLLMAYEFYPDAYKDQVNIPESGNKIPDILNETRVELEWLLKMQDRSSGGVYHKLTSAGFPDIDVMPDADVSDLLVLPISSLATGDFAAVMAMASRIYKPFDASFSKQCLDAAEKAWGWLVKNKQLVPFKNPEDVSTGEYGDGRDTDERYWAASELLRSTGKSIYQDAFSKAYKALTASGAPVDGFSATNTGGFGTVTYLFGDQDKRDSGIYSELGTQFIGKADELVKIGKKDGYGISLTSQDYIWGSNMVVMDKAMHLIIANELKPNKDYVDIAQNHLHYLMGNNALSQSYVTGFGSKPILQPHHRPSVGDGIKKPVPGFVSGGPDSRLDDSFAKSNLQGKAPARCFGDDLTSYSTNEIAIYWNTPAVFVAGYFDRD